MLGGIFGLGNVRTDQVKRTARELVRRFPDRFSRNFDDNKHAVGLVLEGATAKIRNQIAGYIARYLASEEIEAPESKEELLQEEGEAE